MTDPDPLLAHWTAILARRIAAVVADARAHAAVAVATSPRPTRSAPFRTALDRLDALAGALAALRSDARAALVIEAFQRYEPTIPAALRDTLDIDVEARLMRIARELRLFGRDRSDALAAPLVIAKTKLNAAVALANPPGTVDRLAAWERATRDALTAAASRALGDDRVALDTLAQHALTAPDALDDSPLDD